MSPGVSEVLQLFWYSVIQKYHSRCFVYYLSDQKIFRLSSINVLSVLYFYQVLTAILPDGQFGEKTSNFLFNVFFLRPIHASDAVTNFRRGKSNWLWNGRGFPLLLKLR